MTPMPRRAVRAAGEWHVRVLLLAFGVSGIVGAQVSPGRLSKVHESVDSPLQCLRCHILGAGKPKVKCYSCHEEIRKKVKANLGYHARAMKGRQGEPACAECHAEHFGRNFNIISWKTNKEEFDHRETGYVLQGKHAGLSCERCHQPKFISAAERPLLKRRDLKRTLLGLSPQCASCHPDVHSGQVGADCARCHTQNSWKPASGFRHESSKYPLTGLHERVACIKCHKPANENPKNAEYTGLAFADCAPCHQDPHKGAFPQRCQSCHSVAGWKIMPNLGTFAHDKTKYPLRGKHAATPCLKCHKSSNFHAPVAHSRCLDCHRDIHKGQFARRAEGGDCKPCHDESKFIPAIFPLSEHQKTKYALTGKHATVKCALCHKPAGAATDYHPPAGQCQICHKDAHAGQFAGAPWQDRCDACHDTGDFRPSTFTLALRRKSRFPTPGAHAAVPCADCHLEERVEGKKTRRFRFPSLECTACHRDPHGVPAGDMQAGARDCSTCHTQNSWRTVLNFDHARTKFALEGAHRAAGCIVCHKPAAGRNGVRVIAFSPTPRRCSDCHEDVHRGQFAKSLKGPGCDGCHGVARWKPFLFNHQTDSRFSLTGGHKDVRCQQCHVKKAEIGGVLTLVYNGTSRKCSACH